jgi:hypothetical protein
MWAGLEAGLGWVLLGTLLCWGRATGSAGGWAGFWAGVGLGWCLSRGLDLAEGCDGPRTGQGWAGLADGLDCLGFRLGWAALAWVLG